MEQKIKKIFSAPFLDEVKIWVKGGRGGNGCMSFRRERGVPRGGPDGGDGGDGGSVILKVDKKISTLIFFHYHNHFRAGKGEHGKGKNKHGRKGKDIFLKVPPGTLVKDEKGEILADLKREKDELVVAQGGKGGRGNAQFKSSVHQTPRETEEGKEGEKKCLSLELKLIADVGIIGAPNAGKSTLLSKISNAHPKIASYPFTTLRPYIGIVRVDEVSSFIAADLPGLIEGAHMGKGLGDRFLRHIERCKILIHLVDVGSPSSINPINRFQMINRELENYNPNLLKKPQIVVANKMDLLGARMRFLKLKEKLDKQGFPLLPISAIKGEGVRQLIGKIAILLGEGR
ncbi:GTPase ObgE [Candidatus Aerophobetes bacterium]|nr:GTPase ObgE [Candidatus Aerophobetes bacterium]